MIELTREQILRNLQLLEEEWFRYEAEKGFGDQRITDAQREIEGIQNALKEAL